jgi:hypothetical protein
MPRSLVNSSNNKRYQKAIDTTTGEVIGYARWVLPPRLAEKGVWEDAMLVGVEVSATEKKELEERFNAVSENGQLKGFGQKQSDFRNVALEEADARVAKNGTFLCKFNATNGRIKAY